MSWDNINAPKVMLNNPRYHIINGKHNKKMVQGYAKQHATKKKKTKQIKIKTMNYFIICVVSSPS